MIMLQSDIIRLGMIPKVQHSKGATKAHSEGHSKDEEFMLFFVQFSSLFRSTLLLSITLSIALSHTSTDVPKLWFPVTGPFLLGVPFVEGLIVDNTDAGAGTNPSPI